MRHERPESATHTYRGRFAPSPTGPLHFGSLVAAVGSYVDARAHGGAWLVRIEDLDPPREVPGAADDILATLQAFGLRWDEDIVYQSRRTSAYEHALARLIAQGDAFPCACTRKEIADSALGADGTPIYPGTCRHGVPAGRVARAVRVRVRDEVIDVSDLVQDTLRQNLATDVGDFIVKRADGWFAYQLAVVIDDAWQGITHVVRGADLFDSTPRQIWLQRLLDLPTPFYLHLPVATDAKGEKLSKQTLAAPVERSHPAAALIRALQFLGQAPPEHLAAATPAAVLDWAVRHWRRERIPAQRSLPID